ncbi:MAG: ATP-dependent DNA helicase RecG [Vampirovibrio sp.]|nr:ATP-dependent DNA helicase RecG [Vampirovibrio sp.]
MLSLDETELQLKDLKQALAFEKKHQYVDVQGRKKPFSKFMIQTLQELTRSVAADSDEVQVSLKHLIDRFKKYRFMDLGNRIDTLDTLEAFLQTAFKPSEPRRKTATKESVPEDQSVHEVDVQYLKGVGPKLSKILNQAGIYTVEDILYYFPRTYLDYQHRMKIAELSDDEDVTIVGTIRSHGIFQTKRRNLYVVNLNIADETGTVIANWFLGGKNAKAFAETYRSRYPKGSEVMVSGKVKWDGYKRKFLFDRPNLEILSYHNGEEDSFLNVGRIVPIYPLTEGLNLRFLRKAIHQALQDYLAQILDPLPPDLMKRYHLIDLHAALQQIHFPDSQEQYETARHRLVFDEFFYVQARLAIIRHQYKQNAQGLTLKRSAGGQTERFMQMLPFELTSAQKRVFEEITDDMASHEPMYRMLQGDVGSGKTVVAILTLLIGVENGYQGALMAPTEILAEQHYKKLVDWLTPLGLRVGLIVGKNTTKERRELCQSLLNGQIHIAVGTHALISEGVDFQSLGVIVVDEQHRFGVRQRTELKKKGDTPEMLTMTATPIPRSLAMTLHGDLDVSLLNELPPGRTPIITHLMKPSQERKAHQLIRQEVVKGRQIYVVLPLVEESETLSAKAATTECARLKEEVFPEFRIGLLHGKMKPDEKEAVMSEFNQHQLDILVSTTVVEVGVDVPNATVIVIENADRFGLAQLHQLRGRVGRGRHQSHCVLISNAGPGSETFDRLKIMEQSEDGFYIAEKDMEIRGPGEFLGTRQSGLPDFLLADLVQDKPILEEAREAAFYLVEHPDYLLDHPEMQRMIFQKTEETFQVLGSG